jgi:predicted enzyme related to lactoylglutathione lyase
MLPRRGPGPTAMQAVNAFVCTVDVANLDTSLQRAVDLGGSVALPKMPIPMVGWLAYISDTEGNILGMLQADSNAK